MWGACAPGQGGGEDTQRILTVNRYNRGQGKRINTEAMTAGTASVIAVLYRVTHSDAGLCAERQRFMWCWQI